MGNQVSDVIIVGGGVIGLCTAFFAADSGGRVLVLERDESFSSSCSRANAGFVAPSHCVPLPGPGVLTEGVRSLLRPLGPLSFRFRLDPGIVGWLFKFVSKCRDSAFQKGTKTLQELCRQSIALHRMLSEQSGGACGFKGHGMICAYRQKKAFEAGLKHAERMGAFGIQHRVEREQAISNNGPVHAAIVYPDDGSLDPRAFLRWMEMRCLEKGVKILKGAEVLGFEIWKNRIYELFTTRGRFLVRQVVVCAGIWSGLLMKPLGIRLDLQAAKGYSVTFDCPDHGIGSPVLLEEPRLAITPLQDRVRISGILEFSGLNGDVDTRRIDGMHRDAARWMPLFGGMRPSEIWRGFRPCTPDGIPIISRSRRIPNLLVCTGHGAKGMLLGPVSGKRMAELLSTF